MENPGLNVDVLIVLMKNEVFCMSMLRFQPGYQDGFFGNIPVQIFSEEGQHNGFILAQKAPPIRISYEQRSCFHFPSSWDQLIHRKGGLPWWPLGAWHLFWCLKSHAMLSLKNPSTLHLCNPKCHHMKAKSTKSHQLNTPGPHKNNHLSYENQKNIKHP